MLVLGLSGPALANRRPCSNFPSFPFSCFLPLFSLSVLLPSLPFPSPNYHLAVWRKGRHAKIFVRGPNPPSTFGDRSFAVNGPCVWDSLPASIRDPSLSLTVFRNSLKTLGAKNMQNFGRFYTTSNFDLEYLRNDSKDIQKRKANVSRSIPPAFQEKGLVNFGPLITEI